MQIGSRDTTNDLSQQLDPDSNRTNDAEARQHHSRNSGLYCNEIRKQSKLTLQIQHGQHVIRQNVIVFRNCHLAHVRVEFFRTQQINNHVELERHSHIKEQIKMFLLVHWLVGQHER